MNTNTEPSFPISGYIRPKRLAKLLGVSEATIWRKAKNGTLPRPVKLSERVTAFDAVEINVWLKSRREAA
ncbi:MULTISPECIES: helix-turn-helix transcriptional regulator [Yersinia pseudotuberculosis complex]|uniref:AlpA family protein n=1 Tax=Yersinia wautersii TaxID=1341643 RepID=A0ABM9TJF3_9GAMM|nr:MULTISPECIES: AlpA family phage regulatory protein [Yersinia pseudotuberculosis complex]CRG51556.1 AlpA family protein [Yersinia wautersii]CRY73696.1 AlpA family protein [Yersinia pseudotuberculosis]